MSPGGSVQDEFGNSDGTNEVDLAMTDGSQNGTNETGPLTGWIGPLI